MKLSRAIAYGLLVLLAIASVVLAQRAPSAAPAPSGLFAYAGDAGERAAIAAAIEQATGSLPRAQANEWRARLDEMTRPPETLSLTRQGTRLVVEADDSGVQLSSPSDTTRVALAGAWELEQRVVGGVLEQRIDDGNLDQRYAYALDRSGQNLVVQVSIAAPLLREPIAYRLSYARQ